MNKLRTLIAGLLFAPIFAQAATVTAEISTPDTTVTPNTGGSFTPVVGDLLVVASHCPGTALTTAQVTSSIGGNTFTQVADAVRSNNDRVFWHVADQLIAGGEDIAQTISFAVSGDECTGSIITVYAVAGMTNVGAAAIRSVSAVPNVAETNEGTSGADPVTTFPNATLTGNVTLGAVLRLGLLTFTEPPGWTEGFDTQLDDAGDSTMESVYRNSGFTGTVMTWGNTAGNVYAAASIELDTSAGASPPDWTAVPALDDCDSDSCIFDFQFDTTADLHWAVYTTGATPPATCAAVEAGSGSLAHDTEDDQTGAQSVDIPFSLIQGDFFFCGENGDGETDVEDVLDQNRDARSGFTILALTSVSATSDFDDDAYYTPDISDDFLEYQNVSNESANCKILFEADGDYVYYDSTDGVDTQDLFPGVHETGDAGDDAITDCSGRITFEYSIQDKSSTTTGLLTAPANMFAADDTIVINDPPVVCEIELTFLVWPIGVAISPIDLNAFCSHPLGDELDFTSTGDSLPTGLSKVADEIDGTPTVEDEGGVELAYEACTVLDNCATVELPIAYLPDTWTVPNLVGLTASAAADAIVTAAPWRETSVDLSITGLTCAGIGSGLVLTQNPAATSEAEPFENVDITLSRTCTSGGRPIARPNEAEIARPTERDPDEAEEFVAPRFFPDLMREFHETT